MNTIKIKQKKVTGFGTIHSFDTIAMTRFEKKLAQSPEFTDVEKCHLRRLYYCIQLGYLTENFRYNRKHYSSLADNLGFQHNIRKMVDLIERSNLFVVSEAKDKYGIPLWFYPQWGKEK